MKNKKTLAKVIFVIVLIAIIVYTFRDSAGPILQQLRDTSLLVLALVGVSSVIYHIFEGWITYSLARRYNPNLKFRTAVACAFYCSFYRLATLGSATGIAAIMFLNRKGIEISKGTGLYMVQYVFHKVSIAIFSGIFFLLNWKFMVANYSEYGVYLILAYALTVLISIGLILLAVYEKLHMLIFWIAKHFNKSGKLDEPLKKLEANLEIMKVSTAELLKEKGTLVAMLLKNLAKLCFWYIIPFLILYKTGLVTVMESMALSSLSVMTAAVIPTPAGVGALELIMTSLFGVIAGVGRAGAVTLLYRFATFIFPFIIGAVVVLYLKVVEKKKN